jgi:hypothetical protein
MCLKKRRLKGDVQRDKLEQKLKRSEKDRSKTHVPDEKVTARNLQSL